jgi:hypothetical protein
VVGAHSLSCFESSIIRNCDRRPNQALQPSRAQPLQIHASIVRAGG